jgi:ribulose-bisphosphate carboxylase large chain
VTSRLTVFYHIRSEAAAIEARARSIAVEQSVEMPVEAIENAYVLDEIVGQVEAIDDLGGGLFEVRIGLATATTGLEAGQLINMLFGNSSIHDDVVLHDVDFPAEVAAAFGGPNHGLDGLRRLVGADARAMTCSALKPQGLPAEALGELAGALARGGLDFIKDDHGLADQAYGTFADRVKACSGQVRRATEATGHATRYLPSLSGNLDQLRRQVAVARDEGVAGLLIAPMIVGLPALHTLVRDYPDMVFMAHPALAGASRMAPSLLLGKLFRLFGADAVVFPNHGGRFGYSPATCRTLAEAARAGWSGVRAAAPVPAGGMTVDRTTEILDFYGPDVILLIGGSLLAAGDRLAEQTAAFTASVRQHPHG